MRRPNEAANVILTRPVKGSTLKGWGMRLAARAGMRKAKVARARKLAVVLHRMLANGTSFLFDKTATAVARSAKEKETQVRAVQIGRSEQSPVAGTMDQVRPMRVQQGIATALFRLADLFLI